MKTSAILTAALLAVSPAAAHYRFNQINKNGVFKYIRENTSNNSPVTDLASNDLRCNTGAKGEGTETVAVKAGSCTYNPEGFFLAIIVILFLPSELSLEIALGLNHNTTNTC